MASFRNCNGYSSRSNRFDFRQRGHNSLTKTAIRPTAIKVFARAEHIRSKSELNRAFIFVDNLGIEGTAGFEGTTNDAER